MAGNPWTTRSRVSYVVAYLLVLFSNLGPCTWLRNTTCEYLDAFFLHGPEYVAVSRTLSNALIDASPLHVEWYFNSYLTALLLLYTSHDAHFAVYTILGTFLWLDELADDVPAYVAIVLALPFGVSALKTSYADGADDHSALDKITCVLLIISSEHR